MKKIAIIGTGLMGSAFAEALLSVGHQVIVYNRTRARAQPVVRIGAVMANSVAEAIELTDFSILVLPDAKSVQEVLINEETQAVLQNKKILNASTTTAQEIIDLQIEIAKFGGQIDEVSIMVGADQLRAKESAFILGCIEENKAIWTDLLQAISTRIDYAGYVGSASNAEVPMLIGSVFGVVATAYAAAASIKLGIPKEIAEHYILMSIPNAEYLLPNLFTRNYDQVMASVDNFAVVAKNASLACNAAKIPSGVLEQIEQLFTGAKAVGYGDKDGTAISEILLKTY